MTDNTVMRLRANSVGNRTSERKKGTNKHKAPKANIRNWSNSVDKFFQTNNNNRAKSTLIPDRNVRFLRRAHNTKINKTKKLTQAAKALKIANLNSRKFVPTKSIRVWSCNINGKFNRIIDNVVKCAEAMKADILHIQEAKILKCDITLSAYITQNYDVFTNLLTNQEMIEKYKINKIRDWIKEAKNSKKNNTKDSEKRVTNVKQLVLNNSLIKIRMQKQDWSKRSPSGGLITLIKRKWSNNINIVKDSSKRIMTTVLTTNREAHIISNIYAPSSTKSRRSAFFTEKVIPHLQYITHEVRGFKISYILGGDFNVKKKGVIWDKTLQKTVQINCRSYNTGFNTLLKQFKLIDAGTHFHGKDASFTFERLYSEAQRKTLEQKGIFKVYQQRTRIDLFLTKEATKTKIMRYDTGHDRDRYFTSDHFPIMIEYKIRQVFVKSNQNSGNLTPRLKTKQAGMTKLREIGERFTLNEPELKKMFERFESCPNDLTKKNIYSQQILDLYVANMFNFFKSKIGVTKSKKFINRGWNHVCSNEVKQMAKDKYLCKKLDKAIKIGSNTKRINLLRRKYNAITGMGTIEGKTCNTNNLDASMIMKSFRIIHKEQKQLLYKLKQDKINKCITRLMNTYHDNPKRFFNNIMRKFQNHKDMRILKNPDNKKCSSTDPKVKLKYARKFWQRVYTTTTARGTTCPDWLQVKRKTKFKDTIMNKITLKELKDTIENMQNFKASGEDKVPVEIYKALPEEQLSKLLAIYNSNLNNCFIPKNWKRANIKLIYKEGDEQDLSNYRPISLINVQYKIFANIIRDRLAKFLEDNKLLSHLQNGFRKNRGTFNNLNSIINIIEDAKYNKRSIHLLYIDIRKAFDSIEHWVLKDTLRYYNLQDKSIRLIMNMYEGLSACIDTPFGKTKEFNITKGVRQGDGLSPLLFILAINPILELIEESHLGYSFTKNEDLKVPILAYADDLVLITNNAEDMDNLFSVFKKMTEVYGLTINSKKSKYTSNEAIAPLVFIDKEGTKQTINILTPQQNYKFLGIHLNLELNWKKNTDIALRTFKSRMTKIANRKLATDIKLKIIK